MARVYQLLFTCSQTISMKNLNGKQNLRPEKGIYNYLVKFYRNAPINVKPQGGGGGGGGAGHPREID